MRHFTGLAVGVAGLISCAGALWADTPVGMAPQPPVSFSLGTSGSWNTAWQGVPGRTYLMEWSMDLATWSNLPLTEAGAGTKAYSGRNSGTNTFFVRLLSSDETPDLATATNWEPPLLRVAGQWTVATSHKDKTAASGVRLSLYRWPAAAAAPLTTPLLVAATGTDGTYTFDPSALGADNRVEVRITGSPNQRVYLPWKVGIDNTYNERSELLSEIQRDADDHITRSEGHIYDSAENRISTTITTTSGTLSRLFEYGNATNLKNSNQLYQLTETPGVGTSTTFTYDYDNNGNRTGRAVGGYSDAYTYDTFNRLTQLLLNTSSPAENENYNYAYDPLTRRISRSVGVPPTSSIHLFAFSGNTPAHEWNADDSSSLVDNIGGGVGGLLYSRDTSGLITYPIHNARGDIVAQVAPNGQVWHGTYAANGLLQSQTGPRPGNYGANGKWEEPGGLINDGFRYRDRLTDTFLTPDPAGFIDGPNVYNYVGHNPWSAWDPNGLAVMVIAGSLPGESGGIGTPPIITAGIDLGIPPSVDLNALNEAPPTLVGTLPNLANNDKLAAKNAWLKTDHELFHPKEYSPSVETWRNRDGSVDWGSFILEALARVPDYVVENGWTQFKHNFSDPEFVASSAMGGMGTGGLSKGLRTGIKSVARIAEETLAKEAAIAAAEALAAAANSARSQVLVNQAAGNAARDAIAASRPGSLIEQNFRVTGGLRRVDVLDSVTAIESKVGRTSLTPAVRQELARDIKIMRSGQADAVEWHFSPSPTTGKVGPTGPLRTKLDKFGIPIVE